MRRADGEKERPFADRQRPFVSRVPPDVRELSTTYGLTVMRSLMSSNTSLGTTFFATSSPFTYRDGYSQCAPAISCEIPE